MTNQQLINTLENMLTPFKTLKLSDDGWRNITHRLILELDAVINAAKKKTVISEEGRKSISKAHSKSVQDLISGEVFKSAYDASEKTGYARKTINQHANIIKESKVKISDLCLQQDSIHRIIVKQKSKDKILLTIVTRKDNNPTRIFVYHKERK